ncbi:hypothetical protein [Flavobacterium ginsenosidimutans]|uniref:hypothetical protein n=1 Tax=Flavobacterium ginsenosidimutans TaxID=687844 RepID=UPI0013A673C9|nr:hypothetical protein [Flavobacterium ginsenosidimutans]KAF2328095.1 hypothetical protein DM444_20080 [Flavobacterium ginsenosidimutans]
MTEIIKFHFYSLRFTPYSHLSQEHNSDSILKDVVTYLMNELHGGKGHLIDRNRNRPNEMPRELFVTNAVFMAKERRIRCSIALLRSGRVPKIKPVDEYKLVPITSIGKIAEETHFYIDYSRNYGVVCIEYNYHGPRISDVEYYLRNVARDVLKLSKITEVNLYMSNTIDKTLASLKNVLNLDIKLQPRKLAQMDTDLVGKYFTGINSIGNSLKPKFIKVEAMFQSPGKNIESAEINKEANSMVMELVRKFKTRPFNIDCFENFVVRYEDKEGNQDFFDLLNGKVEIIKEIELATLTNKRKWYELIEKDFDDFMINFGTL